jgi:hypothetical protein
MVSLKCHLLSYVEVFLVYWEGAFGAVLQALSMLVVLAAMWMWISQGGYRCWRKMRSSHYYSSLLTRPVLKTLCNVISIGSLGGITLVIMYTLTLVSLEVLKVILPIPWLTLVIVSGLVMYRKRLPPGIKMSLLLFAAIWLSRSSASYASGQLYECRDTSKVTLLSVHVRVNIGLCLASLMIADHIPEILEGIDPRVSLRSNGYSLNSIRESLSLTMT